MSDWADNYDALATDDDGSCALEACMDPNSDNYDANATDQTPDAVSSDTTISSVLQDSDNGATDAYGDGCSSYSGWWCWYADSWADDDFNASTMCTACGGGELVSDTVISSTSTPHCFRNGCMDSDMDNYDALATVDDGSCFRNGCTNPDSDNYDALATVDDGSCFREGCTNTDSDLSLIHI